MRGRVPCEKGQKQRVGGAVLTLENFKLRNTRNSQWKYAFGICTAQCPSHQPPNFFSIHLPSRSRAAYFLRCNLMRKLVFAMRLERLCFSLFLSFIEGLPVPTSSSHVMGTAWFVLELPTSGRSNSWMKGEANTKMIKEVERLMRRTCHGFNLVRILLPEKGPRYQQIQIHNVGQCELMRAGFCAC